MMKWLRLLTTTHINIDIRCTTTCITGWRFNSFKREFSAHCAHTNSLTARTHTHWPTSPTPVNCDTRQSLWMSYRRIVRVHRRRGGRRESIRERESSPWLVNIWFNNHLRSHLFLFIFHCERNDITHWIRLVQPFDIICETVADAFILPQNFAVTICCDMRLCVDSVDALTEWNEFKRLFWVCAPGGRCMCVREERRKGREDNMYII